ncbi:putative proline racemase [Aspergillus avenaceus]|uniref:trans-L-3-hydroxyproline dehydratase n=1 Tax=Aspergillus avenaceus TaxID=36643 RepID=A0A5N6TTB4_ASPAV|nr:putative proline racemase [Aspergillus avenaceus]
MDVFTTLQNANHKIHCIDMHTTGEPTRIIYNFPPLTGTLLSKRDQAKEQHDHIRKRLMLEPRGHDGMYGAIIIPETELVESGEADVGVLFVHNEGYSTMCGHATIALGRFLVDTHDLGVFPRREKLELDEERRSVRLNLHAPCGLVRVTVPTTPDGRKSDPEREVEFLSVPSFAPALQLRIPVPDELRWPELRGRDSIVVDVSYGGAYYALVDVQELGFESLKAVDLDATSRCVQKLHPYLKTRPEIISAIRHPEDPRLSFLYSVMIVDGQTGVHPEGMETGLCYFAANQIDRSPTGSCVAARVALAYEKGVRKAGQKWAYNSLVSNHFGTGSFTSEIAGEESLVDADGKPMRAVTVKVGGRAFYTGAATFMVEDADEVSRNGFTMGGVTV